MPQQVEGRMRGFQLWINLPAREKMKPANYRDIDPSEIAVVPLADGGSVKVIAGKALVGGTTTPGPIDGLTTDPLYLDVALTPGGTFTHPIAPAYNAFVYVYEGAVSVGAADEERALETHNAGLLSAGDGARVRAGADGARFLLLAGRPLGEPIVQYGPFVMNTREEIEQAIRDYQNGQLAA
jgi:hypothetical protein